MRVRAKVAVSTVNGKAYYKLVNELKSRGILFLSIVPGETIPSSIKVVITTENEKHLINHPQVLVYDIDSDPSIIINEAQKIIAGKDFYEELIIGIDPGKTFGIAVLADGKTIKREEFSNIDNMINFVLTEINLPSKVKKVRIGRGMPDLAEEIARRLGRALPGNVVIEIVSEEGTSTSKEGGFKRKLSDSESAIRIASRRGERFRRDASK
ncbi:hypothetical protein KEJ29_05615 [Candidatus Bathyarchaeota archaeon]|nr:hypothetical protein [Candidatus Bathyarchaeota archaeon]